MYVQTSGFERITKVDQGVCNGRPQVVIHSDHSYISFPVDEAEDMVMMLLGAIAESKRLHPPADAITGDM